MRVRIAACALGLLLSSPVALRAQAPSAVHFGAAWEPPPLTREAPGAAFIASAILPGAGQFLLKEERWVPYVVLEAWALVSYLDRRRDGRTLETRFKDLAWSVPRRISEGPRRDTSFQYYESLTKYEASGNFDFDPAQPGVQPEENEFTHNGAVWRLARSIYLPGGTAGPPGSPAYQRALEYYLENAVPATFAWAWGASRLEQQAYRDLIKASDESYRAATRMLGVIVANHIVSAIDALVTARLRQVDAAGIRVRMRGGMEPAAGESRLTYQVQLWW